MSDEYKNRVAIIGGGLDAVHAIVRAIECGDRIVVDGYGARVEEIERQTAPRDEQSEAAVQVPDGDVRPAVSTTLTDEEVLADLKGDKCRACDGRKRENYAFCATDFAALTIFQRRQMSMGLKAEAFHDKYRSALRHLQLNPTRIKQLPSRGGEWSYRSEDDLENAGFKFMEHARCNVPHCYQRIVWYRTPNGGQMPVNLEDYQPHKTSCKDPEYFQRKREERAQTFARKRAEKKLRQKRRRA